MKKVGDYFDSQKNVGDMYTFVTSGNMFYDNDRLMLTTSFSNTPSTVMIGLDSRARDSEHDLFLEIRNGLDTELYHMGKISGVPDTNKDFKTEDGVKNISDIIKPAFEALTVEETSAAIYVTRNIPLNKLIGHYK